MNNRTIAPIPVTAPIMLIVLMPVDELINELSA